MKPFKDTYVMYQLLDFIDESSIICLCKASKKLNEICKQYIELEDERRFEIIVDDRSDTEYINSELLEKLCLNNDVIKIKKLIKRRIRLDWVHGLIFDWDYGLWGACKGGHIEIVKLMIDLRCNWWNGGLSIACEHGYIEIVKLMIEKGATYCYCSKTMEEHLKKN